MTRDREVEYGSVSEEENTISGRPVRLYRGAPEEVIRTLALDGRFDYLPFPRDLMYLWDEE